IVWFHISASNANLTLAVPFVTGGSWKKSPSTERRDNARDQTWIPPKGSADFRSMLPNLASLSNRSPSTIETET
ncbi:hypothetical protein PAXRUDRAFT_113193, partial [Paxillus rubicundulus Ve08.2h10]